MGQTPNYGLYIEDDPSTKFQTWREKINGSAATSNMQIIDAALGDKMDTAMYDPNETVADAGGIPAYVAAHAPSVTVDVSPTSGSNNPVSSGGVYIAVHTTKPISEGGTGAISGERGLYNLINAASALASSDLADGDYVGIDDVSASTGKKATLADLKTFFSGNAVEIKSLRYTKTGSYDLAYAISIGPAGGQKLILVRFDVGYHRGETNSFTITGINPVYQGQIGYLSSGNAIFVEEDETTNEAKISFATDLVSGDYFADTVFFVGTEI